jgi:PAP2 superfamily C-terminal
VYQENTARMIYSFSLFYFSRSIVQSLFTFKFLAFANWEWPGFPSLMVPYGMNSDFYISGHTGFFVLMIGEMHLIGMPLIFKLCGFAFLFYEIMVLLIYRQHYSIDIISGLVYSFWVHLQTQKFAGTLDRMFVRFRIWLLAKYSSRRKNEHVPVDSGRAADARAQMQESSLISNFSGGVKEGQVPWLIKGLLRTGSDEVYYFRAPP